jgi:4'-phosphopantetheinyl transferase
VAAHALKRMLLSSVCGVKPAEIPIVVQKGGKPMVSGRGGPCFSLSHCNDLVACAVSPTVPLGVDVERTDAPISPDVLDLCLRSEERAYLGSLAECTRLSGFYRIWTLKEAFCKATGNGLSQGLQTFSIGFDPLRVDFHDPARVVPGTWRLSQQCIQDNHVLGIAWDGPEALPKVHVLNL